MNNRMNKLPHVVVDCYERLGYATTTTQNALLNNIIGVTLT